jgi:DNA-binding transcriptional ArsR family regulator
LKPSVTYYGTMVLEPSRVGGDAAPEVFKALSDPIRWSIVTQIAAVDELPCATLEERLPVSKPTISYHTRILHQAGLLSMRKKGRNYFYALRRDVLQEVLDVLWQLAPGPLPVDEGGLRQADVSDRRRGKRSRTGQSAGRGPEPRLRKASGDDEVVVLTW